MDRLDFNGKEYNPETLALGYGYDAAFSEGAVKPPVFLTSTFQFKSAMDGKKFFELAYGLREKEENEDIGLIYSRINNPNLQIFEERIAAWDKTEEGAVFASGMAAIMTSIFCHAQPGDTIISSAPVYGGTHYLFEHILPKYKINVVQIAAGENLVSGILDKAKEIGEDKIKMLYLETPANPSNKMVDIEAISKASKEIAKKGGQEKVLVAVDNTFLGPVFQRPALFGADLVIYSATKFIGGHSDLIAGVVTGSKELIKPIKDFRTIFGTMANPFTGWMLLRSLETLSIRMRRQAKNAVKLAELLQEHPKVKRVMFPTLFEKGSRQREIFEKQCTGPGSLIAFEIDGGEEKAFKLLDSFKVFRLAVSLGGTESLVEHPMTMTHSDVDPAELETYGVTAGVIRMSVGIEHSSDLKRDVEQALDQI
jgi:methionine-gamma-lyase